MNELGHVFHRCHDIEEWDSEPKEGLQYQPDYKNEDYYSVYTDDEMTQLKRDVRVTGNFDVQHLYHLDDGWEHYVEEFLEANWIDNYCAMQFLSELHCTHFQNPMIGRMLALRILKHDSVYQVIHDLIDRYEMEEDPEDFEEYKDFLEELMKEKLRDKLDAQLEPRHSTRAVKI